MGVVQSQLGDIEAQIGKLLQSDTANASSTTPTVESPVCSKYLWSADQYADQLDRLTLFLFLCTTALRRFFFAC
jgi:hypothetical protein